jgi:hypothetical protein
MADAPGFKTLRPMRKGFISFTLLALLPFALVACGIVEIGIEPTPVTREFESSDQADPSSDESITEQNTPIPPVATEKADEEAPGTDLAISPTSTLETSTGAFPDQSPIQLPAPVYFINAEDSQIWRVEMDGVSLTQMTSESGPVTDFDVSPKDGALAYISDNQLIYYTVALGGRRQVLIDGSEDFDQNDYVTIAARGISDPLWSPDGHWIAFGYGGIQLYQDPAEPRQEGLRELQTILFSDPLPQPLPEENVVFEGDQNWYSPVTWTQDGEQILVSGAYYFALGQYTALLDVEDGSLAAVKEPKGHPCCFMTFGEESQSLLYAGNLPGIYQIGLWRVNPLSGEELVLIPGEAGSEYHLFAHPFESSSGDVLGFYSSEPANVDAAPVPQRPMVMVSVVGDGSAEFEQLRQDYFVVGGADWLPDGNGAVITDVAGRQPGWPFAGILRWLPADGGPMVTLPAEGWLPQWGYRTTS